MTRPRRGPRESPPRGRSIPRSRPGSTGSAPRPCRRGPPTVTPSARALADDLDEWLKERAASRASIPLGARVRGHVRARSRHRGPVPAGDRPEYRRQPRPESGRIARCGVPDRIRRGRFDQAPRRGDRSDQECPEARSPAGAPPKPAVLVGNTDSRRFHLPTCGSIKILKAAHRIDLASYDEAIALGYQPCNTCSPSPPRRPEGRPPRAGRALRDLDGDESPAPLATTCRGLTIPRPAPILGSNRDR